MENTSKRVNIDVEDKVWQKVGIMAAEMEVPKKEVVKAALLHFWFEHNKAKK